MGEEDFLVESLDEKSWEKGEGEEERGGERRERMWGQCENLSAKKGLVTPKIRELGEEFVKEEKEGKEESWRVK